jgi:hypothetical protein
VSVTVTHEQMATLIYLTSDKQMATLIDLYILMKIATLF